MRLLPCAWDEAVDFEFTQSRVSVESPERRCQGKIYADLRWLLRIVDDYPATPVRAALEEATRYGMTDLERLERMVLRGVLDNFFNPPDDDGDPK